MPSRSSSASIIGALLTATGLLAAAAGVVNASQPDQATGLTLIALGVIPLIIATTRYHRTLKTLGEEREAIQGEAFALAIELWRRGELAPVEDLLDTGGQRYDL